MLSSARDLQLSYPFLFERWYPVPTELIHNAMRNGYRAIAIAHHIVVGSLQRVITEIIKDCALARAHWDIIAIPAVELTLVPAAIAETAKRARDMEAQIVMAHGELPLESVEPGTNLAAAKSPYAAILAPHGLLSLKQAQTAAANDIFIEIPREKSMHTITDTSLT